MPLKIIKQDCEVLRELQKFSEEFPKTVQSSNSQHIYDFGPFRLDAAEHLLLRNGAPVPLSPKAFDMLLVLVRHGGHMLTKDELMNAVWPDAVVEESNLTVTVSVLRRTLGEDPSAHQYIETVPRLGYRFVTPVREVVNGGPELVVRQRIRAQVITEEDETGAPDGTEGQQTNREAQLTRNEALPASDAVKPLTVRPAARLDYLTESKRRTRGAALAVATLVIVATGLYFYFSKRSEGAIDSIAVLPFANVNADAGTEYLSHGLTENLIDSLSQLPNLRVMSRNSVFRYKGQEKDAMAVGRELNVRAVLMGRVRQQGEELLISVELVDAADNSHIWGGQYDRKLADTLAVQQEIARAISERLRLRLTGEAKERLARRSTENSEAYRLYLKGRYFWNKRTPQDVKKGIEYFQQAIELDPLYALAYVGLADCYIVLGAPLNALPPTEAFSKAKAAAVKALEIDETLAEAHASLGVVKQRFDWDPLGAAREFQRAIELNPGYATAHQWYAINFEIMGRAEESVAEAKRALELDPLSRIINARLAHSFYFARRYDEAIEQSLKTVELDPNFAIAHGRLGISYDRKGMYREAIESLLKADALSGAAPEDIATLKQAYAVTGMNGYWRKILNLELERSQRRYVSAYEIAVLHARLDEKELAFAWLEKAFEERSSALVYLKVEPRFDSLRSDPRYDSLLHRIGFAR